MKDGEMGKKEMKGMGMEERQSMPGAQGPKLQCQYVNGKKGETKEMAVGMMAGKGK